jgi:hypothetical protein
MIDAELTSLVSEYPNPPPGYCLLVFQNDSENSRFLTIDVAAVTSGSKMIPTKRSDLVGLTSSAINRPSCTAVARMVV